MKKIKTMSYALLLLAIMISTQNCKLEIEGTGEVAIADVTDDMDDADQNNDTDTDMDADNDPDADTDEDMDNENDNSGADMAKMHMIGLYRGYGSNNGAGSAAVLVLGKGSVDLVLSAHDSVNWVVNSVPGVRIRRVLLLGYRQQNVSGLPSSTEVVDRSDRPSLIDAHPYSLAAPKNYNSLNAVWTYFRQKEDIKEKGRLDMVKNGFEEEYCGVSRADLLDLSQREFKDFQECSSEVAEFQTHINNRIYLAEIEEYMDAKLSTFQGARSPSAEKIFTIQN